jgi:hypothetical protein
MKEYKNLNELQVVDKLIVEDITHCIHSTDLEMQFVESIGGSVFVVETLEDLKLVKGAKDESVFDVVTVFDAVEMIGHDDEFMFFLNVNNESGGPCYYVPKAVYQQCQNCMDSHDMNNGV